MCLRPCYTNGVSNLLVIDFDSFFFDPMANDEPGENLEALLYDWGHREAPEFLSGPLWMLRAQGFLSANMPLPLCRGYEALWDRFVLPDAPLLVADSNAHAGMLTAPGGGPFEQVWLYDAHHDSGYHPGAAQDIRATGVFSCEDWMLVHHLSGASLHVRYPTWRSNAFRLEPRPEVPVDRAFDTGRRNPTVFDQVFLCRSGAWVPPWCDPGFEDLVRAYPHGHLSVDGEPLRRPFDRAGVDRPLEAFPPGVGARA